MTEKNNSGPADKVSKKVRQVYSEDKSVNQVIRYLVFLILCVLIAAISFYIGFLFGDIRSSIQSENTLLEKVSENTTSFINLVLGISVLLAAIGTISASFVELIKAILPIRQAYHNIMIWLWAKKNSEVMKEFLKIGGGGEPSKVWLDQPAEELFSQILDICIVVSEYASDYEDLARFIGASEVVTDSDREKFGIAISNKINAIKLRTKYWWARGNQLVALVISISLIALFLPSDESWFTFPNIFFVVGGAMVAPFMKEFVERLSGLSLKRSVT